MKKIIILSVLLLAACGAKVTDSDLAKMKKCRDAGLTVMVWVDKGISITCYPVDEK